MGDIADGIINGDFDQYTGEYLGRGGGFPRSRGGYKRAGNTCQGSPSCLSEETKVVWQFMGQRGIRMDVEKSEFTKAFGKFKSMAAEKVSGICKEIRLTPESWKEFKTWFDNQLLK